MDGRVASDRQSPPRASGRTGELLVALIMLMLAGRLFARYSDMADLLSALAWGLLGCCWVTPRESRARTLFIGLAVIAVVLGFVLRMTA